jgi:hypothetical protein
MPVVGATTIEPGEQTTVDFGDTMGMHGESMAGLHLFRVTVPVSREDGQQGEIQLYLKGNFY